VPIRRGEGTRLSSSVLTSYVVMIRATNTLISLTAKKRPGLLKNSGTSECGRGSYRVTEVGATYHACRPNPKDRWSADVLAAEFPVFGTSPPTPENFEKRKPSNCSGFEYISPSIWIALDGAPTITPGGIVTPLENVKGRSTRRVSRTRRLGINDGAATQRS
jgi:hypothetical protein